MKIFKIILFLAFSILVASCSSDDNDDNNLQPVTQPFFVEINGEAFEETRLLAQPNIAQNTMLITAIDAQGKDIVLGFTGDLKSGTEFKTALQSNGEDIFVPVFDTDTGGFFATSGSLILISHDETSKTMTGRFSFSGPDPNDPTKTLNFAKGEFIVDYAVL